ncbi:MAG: AMP-binding protein, partial [Bacteroidota bacterium]
MELLDFYKTVNEKIEEGKLQELEALNPPKPEYFNWVEDIFYPLNVAIHGDSPALIWKYQTAMETFDFATVFRRCNQLVNFLRKHQIEQGAILYTMLPLIPENWFSFLAGIKGGFIIMPTATNLVKKDLAYRFESLFPDVIIAHAHFTEEIDQAEKNAEQKIKLKLCVGGQREGWLSFDDILKEATHSEA